VTSLDPDCSPEGHVPSRSTCRPEPLSSCSPAHQDLVAPGQWTHRPRIRAVARRRACRCVMAGFLVYSPTGVQAPGGSGAARQHMASNGDVVLDLTPPESRRTDPGRDCLPTRSGPRWTFTRDRPPSPRARRALGGRVISTRTRANQDPERSARASAPARAAVAFGAVDGGTRRRGRSRPEVQLPSETGHQGTGPAATARSSREQDSDCRRPVASTLKVGARSGSQPATQEQNQGGARTAARSAPMPRHRGVVERAPSYPRIGKDEHS